MRFFLHDVHKMNAYKTGRMFKLDDGLTYFDSIWYELYAIGDHPVFVLNNSVQSVITTGRTRFHASWERH
jgi:hypothetical protein